MDGRVACDDFVFCVNGSGCDRFAGRAGWRVAPPFSPRFEYQIFEERFESQFVDWGNCIDSPEGAAVVPNLLQVDGLTRLMDVAELRHRVISNNLANVNTPAFRRLDVEFEQAFMQELKSHSADGARSVEARIVEEQGLPERADGNNVDIDREIGQLNRNAMLFQTYSQILASQFEMMRRATRGT
jgi:flagellar basal-body rod protein FlgB